VAISGTNTLPLGDARVADITPTLLALLGLTVPGLDGRSLVEAMTEEVPAGTQAAPEGSPLTEDEEAAVMEHLKGLGYVE
jgi:arylsulfatase A-like enzyme